MRTAHRRNQTWVADYILDDDNDYTACLIINNFTFSLLLLIQLIFTQLSQIQLKYLLANNWVYNHRIPLFLHSF